MRWAVCRGESDTNNEINEKDLELRKRTFCWLYPESIAENPKFMNSATVPTLCGVVIGEILESA
jgi:hypothetical protein